jgi:hypothetical protein
MLYLIDANVIIDAKDTYYALDQVPEFRSWVVNQAERGILKMPYEILDEVSPGANKEHPFFAWRKDKAKCGHLLLEEEADRATVQKILNEGYASDLTDEELITIGADPFLVAYALRKPGRIIVTTETSAPKRQRKNRKLPDVCDQFQVPCINTFQLTRNLGWSTTWGA